MNKKSIVSFPPHLIEEFAYRRAVPFVGSGLSATATKEVNGEKVALPTWREFISKAKSIMRHGEHEKEKVDESLKNNNPLKALQIIRDYSDSGDYQKLLKDTFTARGHNVSEAHRALRDLDSKILITTNFDNVYEDFCRSLNLQDINAYVVNSYNEEAGILDNIKSSENLIIKAHGSLEKPGELIFTQFDFFKARREHPNFYKLLSSIFLLKTIFFIGYGINDPDINLLLSSEINNLAMGSPNYVLLPEGTYTKEDEKNWKENYNISIVSYKSCEHNIYGNFTLVLTQFVEEVEELQSQRGISPGVIHTSQV